MNSNFMPILLGPRKPFRNIEKMLKRQLEIEGRLDNVQSVAKVDEEPPFYSLDLIYTEENDGKKTTKTIESIK
jgi:hypothetical protein